MDTRNNTPRIILRRKGERNEKKESEDGTSSLLIAFSL